MKRILDQFQWRDIMNQTLKDRCLASPDLTNLAFSLRMISAHGPAREIVNEVIARDYLKRSEPTKRPAPVIPVRSSDGDDDDLPF